MKKSKTYKINRDTEFLFEISSLRQVDRTWKQFTKIDTANTAEHTFRVVWIAMILAKHEGAVDFDKIIKMTLVHDVAESRCGDVQYLSRQYVNRKEKEAAHDIFQDTCLQKEMIELLEEYEHRKSLEAKIVKDADNLDCEIEFKELEICGVGLRKMWEKSRRQMVYTRLYTKSAKQFWDHIQKVNPHNWHINSPKNRFNSGDWKKDKK